MTHPVARSVRATQAFGLCAAVAAVLSAAACQPTVRVEAPDKPIVINLNVKIEQEVRIKVERDVDTLLQQNEGLF
jgi:hypothetical protein